MTNEPPSTPATSKPQSDKYQVEVITTGPTSDPVSSAGNAVIRSVIERAFQQLGIDTPAGEFTFKSEDGTLLTPETSVADACPKKKCRISAVPTKKQDA